MVLIVDSTSQGNNTFHSVFLPREGYNETIFSSVTLLGGVENAHNLLGFNINPKPSLWGKKSDCCNTLNLESQQASVDA